MWKLRFILLYLCFFIAGLSTTIAQNGYYRSTVAGSGNWSATASWEYSPDNIAWVAITTEGYPGQLGVPTSVLIRDGDIIIFDVSPANNVGSLLVGEGASGTFTFGDNTTARSLTVNGAVTLAANSTVNISANDAIHSLSVGGDITVNGSLSAFSTSARRFDVTLTGTTGTISGSGTTNFASLSVNRTAATTASTDFSISGTLSIANSGTLDIGTQTISGASGSDIISMSSGVLQLSATDFPSGFETITLTGGTVDYNATAAQNIAVVDGDGDPFSYNNLSLDGNNTKTALGNLDINGSISLDAGITFDMGNFTHNVAGNWIQNGSIGYNVGTSTVILDGSGFSQVSNPINNDFLEFYNLSVVGGAVVSINTGSRLRIDNDFSVTGNSSIQSASEFFVLGDFSIAGGSSYTQTAQYIEFEGTGVQNIDVSNTTFTNVYFDNGSPNQKLITGEFDISGTLIVWSDASISDAVGNQDHIFRGAIRIDGDVNFTGTVTTYGQMQDNFDNAINLGTADLFVHGGSIDNGDALTIGGNMTVLSGTYTVEDGASVNGAGAGDTFTLTSGSSIDMDGVDNFPANFSTYTIANDSRILYTRNGAQTVRGGFTMGELELGGGGVKTLDGPVTISTWIDLNNGVLFNMGGFTHTVSDRIYNNSGSTLTSTGDVTILVSDGVNYELIDEGTYTFNNLSINSTSLTGNFNFFVSANLTVNGNFTVNNAGGSSLNVLSLDINDYQITNDFGDVFTLGADVELRTSGQTTLRNSILTFASASVDVESTIRYNRGGAQTLADGFAYGNLYLDGGGNKTAPSALDVNGDFRQIAGNPDFVDGGFTHTVAGNWQLADDFYPAPSGTIIFDGANQLVEARPWSGDDANFFNVTFSGTGTKTLDDNFNIDGSLVIDANVTVDASSNDVDIRLHRNFTNNGLFQHTTGEFYFDGNSGVQNVTTTANSFFGTVDINKPGGTRRVVFQTDVTISRDLFLRGNNELRINNVDLYIGEDLTVNNGGIWTQNNASTLYLNGTNLQNIDIDGGLTVSNIDFSGNGTKNLIDNGLDINGNLVIQNGATFYGNNNAFTLAGDWTNNGVFLHNNQVVFDGGNQTINASSFNRIVVAGTNTKTLGGGITVTDDVTINVGSTLDVSANNYSITVGDDWTNNGTFNARTGLVTFNGNAGLLDPGSSSFHNININKNSGQRQELRGNLVVTGDLQIPLGELETDGFTINIAGSLLVSDILDVNNNASVITFDGTSGTRSITTNGNPLRDVIINALGATYELGDDLTFVNNNTFTLNNGTFSLNGHFMSLVGSGNVTVNNGTFDIDDNATLQIPDNQTLTINGGRFQIVGSAGNPAQVSRSGGTGGYTINQTNGTFAAQYYEILNTEGTGLTISGGTIDALDNFSNGRFLNGTGSYYLDLSGLNFANFVADEVTFDAGPTSNVRRASGSGVITFQDPTGTLAGEVYEIDGGNLIEWTFPSGVFWDGGGDGTSWDDDLNWSSNSEPNNSSNIVLNHDVVAAAYTVRIQNANAQVNRLTLDSQGGNPIGLIVTNGFDLSLSANFVMGASTSLTIDNGGSVMSIAESFANAGGTISHTAGTIEFNGTSGSHSVDFGGQSIHTFELNAPNATYTLTSALDVNSNITLTDGTLDVSTNNYTVSVSGNWSNVGITTFNGRSGTVELDLGGNSTQTISGGPFYNLRTVNGTGVGTATKQLSSNIDVNNRVTIEANTVLEAQSFNIFVGEDWVNNASTSGFTQTSTGTVIFDGAGTVFIDDGSSATTFNNLTFNGNGTAQLRNNSSVNGSVQVSSSVGTLSLETFTLTGNGGGNVLTVAGGSSLRLLNDNFPSTFETINLAANSTVEYLGDVNETIVATTYGNIEIQSTSNGVPVTKSMAGDITVLGSFDIDDTETTLDVNGHTINLEGAFNFPNGGQSIIWDNGLLNSTGVGFEFDQDLSEYANVRLAGSGNKDLNTPINVTGDFTVENGVFFRMFDHTLTATGGVQEFNLNNGAELFSRVPTTTGVAFPTGFDTYGIGLTSRVVMDANVPQTLDSAPTYGLLEFTGGSSVTLNGNLSVDGNFDSNNVTFLDGGFNVTFGGSDIQLNNFSPTVGTTVTFNGTSQTIRETATNNLAFSNIVFAGTGTKTFSEGGDDLDVNGDITVNNAIIVETNNDINFSGATFTNNGTFNHTGNVFTFDRSGNQSINVGTNNAFDDVRFSNGGTKTFSTNGGDFNDWFIIDPGTTVDLGNLTHRLGYGGTELQINGTLISANANIILDGGSPDLPAITVNDLTLENTNQVDLLGNLDVNGNLSIDANSSLDVEAANYSVSVGGDFINNGTFIDRNGTLTFDGSTSPVTIQTNGDDFYNVVYNPGAAVTYNLTSASQRVFRQMTVQSNATLSLNGNELILGSNLGAGKIYTINGTLDVDAGGILRMNNNASPTQLIVNGTLSIVGVNGNIARLTSVNFANNRRSSVTVNGSGTIAARFYLIEYLDESGLVLNSGATVDATNNFSDGIFANMITATNAGPYYYLQTNDVAIGNPINNVTFSFGGVPTPGTHYNVQRNGPAAVSDITFAGTIGGPLAGVAYEDDPGTNIIWPVITTVSWTGAIDTDWHQNANWSSNAVPTAGTDVTIPITSNNPIISGANAECNDLVISDGALTIQNNRTLDINGNLTIGTGNNAGALVVSTSGSTINAAGNWLRGNNGIFSNGGGTVVFDAAGGSVTITPNVSPFGNVEFNGNATYVLSGEVIDINGDLTLTQGVLDPSTNNYDLTLAGDYTVVGGSFDTSTDGEIILDGTAQAISNGQFDELEVAGTGIKTFSGTNTIAHILTINSTLQTAVGASLDMNNNVTIAGTGTFNDAGGGTHTFSGGVWTNNGTYTGTGTLQFDGGNQEIGASHFYNLELIGTGVVELIGNITIGNNFILQDSFNRFETGIFTTTGTPGGTMTVVNDQTIYVEGVDNFPSGFGVYNLDATSFTDYRSTGNQTIRGGVSYGRLRLYNANTKTLGGNITIQDDLNVNDATLDVSANNYTITIGDDWFNNNSGSFIPRVGDVIFNGSGDQQIRVTQTGAKDFYKITVNKSGGELGFFDENHTILDNLVVAAGDVNANGLTITIGGGFDVTGGNILTSGTYVLTSNSGTENLRLNNSTLNNFSINAPGTTFTVLDNFTVNGNFTLTAGTFNGNGNSLSFGNNVADIVSINGVYQIGANGTLALGNGTNLTVGPSGTIFVVGTPGNSATVTSRINNQDYAFQVNGTIHAQHYLFESMDANGIVINSGASIDATNNFSNGTFTDGAGGGTYLRIENTQTHNIVNVNFSQNPGGNASNVTKVVAGSGTLTFTDAVGEFAGEIYDDDPNSLIVWPTPIVLTWTGALGTDWYNAGNWSASAGPNIVPTGAENVVIPSVTNQPILTAGGALANDLTIESGALVILNTPLDASNDLQINGNFALNGTLTLSSATDSVVIGGSWERAGSGVFNNGNSTVRFNGTAGTYTINNGSAPFHNVVIDATASYLLGSNLVVNNNFVLNNGSLDVSSSSYAITIGGNWDVSGNFTPRTGTVTFNRSTAGTATIDVGSNEFYSLIINGGNSTIFQLVNSNVVVDANLTISNSTLDLNGRTLTQGDGAGTDLVSISGTLDVDANAILSVASSSQIQVNSGGNLRLVGSDASNIATLTRHTPGKFSFVVASGGELDAQYYLLEHMNASGIQLSSGATLDATNNFSNGTFSNGTAGGRYLSLTGLTSNFIINNVAFNAGPAINVRATSGSGNYVEFSDASGVLAGPTFEDDDGNPTSGAVRWSTTSSQYTWTGNISTDWSNNQNWLTSLLAVPPAAPDASVSVIIPDVSSGSGNNPLINGFTANANDLTIQPNGNITIQGNGHLTVASNLSNAGTLTIANGSTSNLTVGNNFANSGTLTFGNSSTLILTSSSGIRSIDLGGSALNNFTLNGNSTFQLTSNMDINGNLTISAGSLDVTNGNYTINVAGDWTNNGTFLAQNGRVIFDGTGPQTIDAGGTGATKRFYDVRIQKGNTATLTSDMYVGNNFELNGGILNLGATNLEVVRNWDNTNVTVNAGTSTVILSGATSILFRTNNQAFNNLTINKTGVNQVSFSSNATVTGALTVTAGTLFLNGRTLNFGDGADNIIVNGTMFVDAGSNVFMHQSSSATINPGGTMRVTGTSDVNRARMTGLGNNAGWSMNVNGTMRARYALFEYTGGNGITLANGSTLNATDNFSNSTFQNGIGTSYLTLNTNTTTTMNTVTFNAGPTHNISATAGNYTVSNYDGTLAGARFENDPGVFPGNVIWDFPNTSRSTPGTGTFSYRNEVEIEITANSGVTGVDVDYNGAIYLGNFNMIPRYYRFVYSGPNGSTATANITFSYSDNEMGAINEADLRVWVNNGYDPVADEIVWGDVGGVVDPVNNTIRITNFTLGTGTVQSERNDKNNPMPRILAGSQDFIITDETQEDNLPVELTKFEVTLNETESHPVLEWETATETENYGFEIHRAFLGYQEESKRGEIEQSSTKLVQDTTWNQMLFINGQGTTTESTTYVYEDKDIQEAGSYFYRLTQIDFDGDQVVYDPVEFLFSGPDKFDLHQNYPNPFNPTTTIPYDVSARTQVRIDLFNVLGQRVRTLVNEVRNPGQYKITLNAQNLSSGMYIIRYVADGRQFTKKMILVK